MPSGKQKVDGQLPGLPAAWSARLLSYTFWYSGVSGGGPPSWRQLFGGPTRSHAPLRSGYLLKSSTCAATGVANSAVATTTAYVKVGLRMGILSVKLIGSDAFSTPGRARRTFEQKR